MMKCFHTGTSDVQAYRYNLDKTLDWLKTKVETLAKTLQDKKVHVSSGSHSTTFVRSSKGKEATQGRLHSGLSRCLSSSVVSA